MILFLSIVFGSMHTWPLSHCTKHLHGNYCTLSQIAWGTLIDLLLQVGKYIHVHNIIRYVQLIEWVVHLHNPFFLFWSECWEQNILWNSETTCTILIPHLFSLYCGRVRGGGGVSEYSWVILHQTQSQWYRFGIYQNTVSDCGLEHVYVWNLYMQ